MNRLYFLHVLAFIFFTTSAIAEIPNEATLRLNLKKGSKYEIVTNSKIDYFKDASLSEKVLSMNMDIQINMEVLDKTAEGIHTVRAMITHIKADQSVAGMSIAYDSEEEGGGDGMAAMLAKQFDPMINKSLTLTVNSLGEVTDVKEEEGAQTGNGVVSLSQMAENFFVKLPEQSLKEGDSWQQDQEVEMAQNTSVTMNFKATEIKGGTVEMSYEADESSLKTELEEMGDLELNMSGTYTFDKKTGMLISNKGNNTMKGSDPQMGEFFMVITTEQNTQLK